MEQSRFNETNANKALEQLIKRIMHGRETKAEATVILEGKDNADKRLDRVTE